MPVLELKAAVKAPPDLVWQVISDMDDYARISPNIVRVEVLREQGQNLRRRLFDDGGRGWDEERISCEPGKQLTMRVDAHYYSKAFSSMQYTWSVQRSGGRTHILMRYEYRVRWGFIGAAFDRVRFRPKLRAVCEQVLDNWQQRINAREWAWRMTAGSLLAHKDAGRVHLSPKLTLAEAARLLTENQVGCLPVVDANERLAGMFSERDIVNALVRQQAGALGITVADVMSTEPVVASSHDSVEQIMNRMSRHSIRHLPVVDDNELIGIVSIDDVVRARIRELEGESGQLRDFIETRRFNDLYRQIGPAAFETNADG